LLTVLFSALLAGCNPFENAIYFRVINDDGSPVAGAIVKVSWTTDEEWGPSQHPGTPHAMTVIPDSSGSIHARVSADHYASVEVNEPGFYSSYVGVAEPGLLQHASSATAISIKMRRIVAPRPLIAKRAWVVLPTSSGEAEYDFLAGDLVAPLGKGENSDCVLRWSRPANNLTVEKRGHYEMSFPQPGSGIIAQRVNNDSSVLRSALRSEKSAPIGVYEPSMRDSETAAGFGDRGPWDCGVIYYFRVARHGTILHGKILGEPELIFFADGSRPVLEFTYAVNPSGDLSLEPDTNAISFPKANPYEQPYNLPEPD